VGELVARIQEHVHTNRIRVSEHFQDFDPLRSGSISAARFRQVELSVLAFFSSGSSPAHDYCFFLGQGRTEHNYAYYTGAVEQVRQTQRPQDQ